jgi:hypothetical protein
MLIDRCLFMKTWMLTLLCTLLPVCLFGQATPRWLDMNQRNAAYPEENYFTGFAYSEVSSSRSLQQTTQQVKTDAQADLSKKIRMRIKASTENRMAAGSVDGVYHESELFSNEASTSSDTEVVGVKTESYYDAEKKLVYAFSYANKHEVAGYYKAQITMLLQQIDGALHTATRLVENGEKAKAKMECERVAPLYNKVYYAQDLLTAVGTTDSESLQQQRTESLRNSLVQMRAALEQGTYIYITSNESLLGKPDDIVANKLKSQLATNGCSFVTDSLQADYILSVEASVRPSSTQSNIVFCYADVKYQLYDMRKQKVVFGDELSSKGGSTTPEKAGRKAMENVAAKVVEKLKPWIE